MKLTLGVHGIKPFFFVINRVIVHCKPNSLV
jgi:hypothetical protein